MASLNFPANPADGDYYEGFSYDGTIGVWKRVGGSGAASMTVSETPPTQGLTSGAMWLDSTTGNTYIYYEDGDNSQWVQSAGVDLIASRGSDFTVQTTAPANPVDGDIWYDPTEGFTYIYYEDQDSSQWVQFGLNRNGAPGIDGADGADGADGIGIPAGGTEGQALVKSSATDYAVEWGSVAGGGGLLELASDTINVDFNDSSSLYSRSVAGDVTFTGSDYTAGATKKIYLQGDTVQRSLTFPAGWTFLNDKPTAIGANKKNLLDLNSFGTSESTTVAIWVGASSFEPITASGGTETEIVLGGITYKLHTFTSSGVFSVSAVGSIGDVDYLVVGGGGSGANGFSNSACGGGGGAGALRYATDYTITPGSYTATVGAGGATDVSGNYGNNGSDSSIFGIISNGGGAGATYPDAVGVSNGNASAGGAGGAGGSFQAGGTGGAFGNNGGSHTGTGQSNSSTSSGGGGGASSAGSGGVANNRGGNGGDGLDVSSIFGTGYGVSGVFAGGGGGGASQVGGGFGGLGGGANGGLTNSSGSAGNVNTGGGGGGGSSTNTTVTGGAGGSGIVIVRYPITDPN